MLIFGYKIISGYALICEIAAAATGNQNLSPDLRVLLEDNDSEAPLASNMSTHQPGGPSAQYDDVPG